MLPPDVVMPLSDSEFATKVASERNLLAGLGIGLTIADLYNQMYPVSVPFDKGPKYSLIVDLGPRGLKRVFVQVAATHELAVNLGRISYRTTDTGAEEVSEPKFHGTEFDYLAVVDRKTHDVYYVPSELIDFRKARLYITSGDRLRFRVI